MDKVAVVFPGQGSQYVGMGKDLADSFSVAKFMFNKADSVLGEKISDICFNGPEEKLKETLYQQVAVFLVSAVNLEVLKEKYNPDCLFYAGLSLGEYTALYAANILGFEDTLRLVQKRAQFMSAAAKDSRSSMLAVIGLSAGQVEQCAIPDVYIANLNSPGQVVVSVKADKIEEVKAHFARQGAKKVIELKVSGGFHSPFMNSAKDRLSEAIKEIDFRDAVKPIISNADASPHTQSSQIKENLVKQLINPVLWQKSVEFMKDQNIGLLYEVGPSKVLKGIIRKIDSGLEVKNFGQLSDYSQ